MKRLYFIRINIDGPFHLSLPDEENHGIYDTACRIRAKPNSGQRRRVFPHISKDSLVCRKCVAILNKIGAQATIHIGVHRQWAVYK